MRLETGRHTGDRVRKVARVNVFELVFCTKRPVSMRSLVVPTQAYADSDLR